MGYDQAHARRLTRNVPQPSPIAEPIERAGGDGTRALQILDTDGRLHPGSPFSNPRSTPQHSEAERIVDVAAAELARPDGRPPASYDAVTESEPARVTLLLT